jgi:hypothetical protein
MRPQLLNRHPARAWTEANDKARCVIFAALSRLSRARFFFLGDMYPAGYSTAMTLVLPRRLAAKR